MTIFITAPSPVPKPTILYDNRLADATVAASTTAAGFAAANVVDWRPYTWWKPTAMPATLTVDCASAKAADYAVLYGHDLFTQGATVEVRGSTDNFAASNVLVATLTPTSNDPQFISFASTSFRYWRLRFTGATAPSLAIGAIGARFDLYTYMQTGFDPVGRQVVSQQNSNENGQPLGRSIDFEKWSQTVTLQKVTWTWLRSTFLPVYRAHLRSKPFVFAWDTANYPDDLKLVNLGDKLSAPHSPGQFTDLQFDLMGVTT